MNAHYEEVTLAYNQSSFNRLALQFNMENMNF